MKLNQYLTDHFTLYEMVRSETAARHGINNTPSEEHLPKLTFLCAEIFEPVREHFQKPYRPNSVYRCLELNRLLNSSDSSQHVEAEAGDIEIPGVSNFELALFILENLLFDQLILECYIPGVPNSGWVHVSLKNENSSKPKNRFEVYTYSNGVFHEGLLE